MHADELVQVFRWRHLSKETHLKAGRVVESSPSHPPMSCRRDDDYSFSTGAASPTYSTSNYDVNNNVDDVDGSLLALEYQAVLDAERRLRLARSNSSSSDAAMAEGSAQVGPGSDGMSKGTPSHNENQDMMSGGEEVPRG